MSHAFSPRSLALFVIAFTAAGISFGSTPTRIVPAKGGSVKFARTYTKDELNANHLQRMTKTNLVLKNKKGLIVATWNATIRDVLTEKAENYSATGICKAANAKKVECTFDASAGGVEITARKKGTVRVEIPYGQGVLFTREKDGFVYNEFFLGADYEKANTEFDLKRK